MSVYTSRPVAIYLHPCMDIPSLIPKDNTCNSIPLKRYLFGFAQKSSFSKRHLRQNNEQLRFFL